MDYKPGLANLHVIFQKAAPASIDNDLVVIIVRSR
jgi:hypothetical protein